MSYIKEILNNSFFGELFVGLGLLCLTYVFIDYVIIKTNKDVQTNTESIIDSIYKSQNNQVVIDGIRNIFYPSKGSIIKMRSGRWTNLLGKITRVNDDGSYNVKLTKIQNPDNDTDIPKNKLNRSRSKFNVYKR